MFNLDSVSASQVYIYVFIFIAGVLRTQLSLVCCTGIWPLSASSAPVLFRMTIRPIGQAVVRRDHRLGHSYNAQVFLSLGLEVWCQAQSVVSFWEAFFQPVFSDFSLITSVHAVREARLAQGLLLLRVSPIPGRHTFMTWMPLRTSCPDVVASHWRHISLFPIINTRFSYLSLTLSI